ncbi:ATP-binding cassette domain-containing protein [Mediterraneibacter glycyrrhizinilyticus]|uniref:sulfate/molybdate ABC transporter ATP-binding protein n=1 Tax=Mediterraneibacter glycyrrhizinilyticus TaxID=342942 RepID=UPI00195FAD34|nr:ATP-binding cassette domain-containing protein [Mediterraneibacter glycyrrhizinilyticus]MBM6750366.1 ATP-binding cassette domain-containing protein [Mediterraneibacter glycyrrhizinilyticus]
MAISVEIHRKLNRFMLDVSFRSTSRRIGILGASGCGKSMTLKCIAGIETPDAGRIAVEDRVLFDSDSRTDLKPQKRNAGYLFQNYALFPTMTVEKNIGAGLKGNRIAKEKRVKEMVRKFRLEGLEKQLPGQLSGGQQQRVALARIMAYEPDVILLDEPFSALDMFLKDQLQREMVNMLEDYEGTVIMVSHDRDEIYRFSEELLIMDQGKIVAAGPTKEVFRNPENKTAARLTGCKNFSRIRKLGEDTVEAVDWNLVLHVERTVPEDAEYMGYRAHDFIPVWGERGENMLKFDPVSSASLPFEQNYYIRSGEKADADEVICWFVQRDELQQLKEKGKPDYLKIEEEKILFLRR